MKTLYLANPYGFSKQLREGPLRELMFNLSILGAEVWEPFERNNDRVDKTQPDWAYQIGQNDFQDVIDAQGFFGVINGCPPDEGVMVELGIAVALSKPIFLFRDDFRTAVECEDYPLNLMIFAGLPKRNWQRYWFTSLAELNHPSKALIHWLKEGKLNG